MGAGLLPWASAVVLTFRAAPALTPDFGRRQRGHRLGTSGCPASVAEDARLLRDVLPVGDGRGPVGWKRGDRLSLAGAFDLGACADGLARGSVRAGHVAKQTLRAHGDDVVADVGA